MDWEDFAVAIKGLLHFANTYDTVEFYYDIVEEGIGLLGTGAFSRW